MTPAQPRFATVAVPSAARALFTYRIPAPLLPMCRTGTRVVVPFGRSVLTGIVTDLLPAAGPGGYRIKDILEILDPDPVVSKKMLEFTRWVADHYLASWGEVLKAALPPGTNVRSVPGIHLTGLGNQALEGDARLVISSEERSLLERIGKGGGLAWRILGKGKEGKQIHRKVESLVRRRFLFHGALRQEPRVKAARQRILSLQPGRKRGDREAAVGRSRIAASVLRELKTAGGSIPAPLLFRRVKSAHAAVRKFLEKGILAERWVPVEPDREPVPPARPAEILQLNRGQQQAVAAVESRLLERKFRVILLRGITGSGKTEVFLRGIEKAAGLGRRSLYLVPEISLTPLLERTIRSRFPGGVEVLHSGLTGRARLAAWNRIREGRARVVLGTRSAVFAPISDLGLVIVDEEQEESYKQEENPRYHGRDAAIVRGKMAGALVLLGTATPALETHYHAQNGRYDLLQLDTRVEERPLPAVTVVDMREEFRRRGEQVMLSKELEEALRDRMERREQSLVLLNRRGWAAFLLCRSCGKRVQCPRCSISFTYHLAAGVLKCHYCGCRKPLIPNCPDCGGEHLHFGAEGTEQVETVIRAALPGVRLARMDRDTVSKRGRSAEILGRFEAGELDILLGTQMIAKGHHFPRVTLVGVLSADHLLAFPDFRASERTFQLLTQVSGRAGRGEIPGEVVIQAFHTDHYAIRAARDHNPEMFYEKELHYRKIMKYPPFAVMAALIIRNHDWRHAESDAARVAGALKRLGEGKILILGPAPAPIGKLRGEYRYQILIKGEKRARIRSVLNELLERLRDYRIPPRRLSVDIDPISTM